MQIACPSCKSVYEVPQAVLAAAQRVQCVKCDHMWMPFPEQAPATAAAPSRPSAMSDADFARERDTTGEKPEPSPAAPGLAVAPLIAWAASLVLLIGLGWAGLHWRELLMQAWPPSARLFAALGLGERAL